MVHDLPPPPQKIVGLNCVGLLYLLGEVAYKISGPLFLVEVDFLGGWGVVNSNNYVKTQLSCVKLRFW